VSLPAITPECLIWVVLTVYFEAVGEPPAGQKAVVKVILNRAVRNKWPLTDIVKARKQFSCWNDGPQGPIKTNPIKPVDLVRVYLTVLQGYQEWIDGARLRGATHFYSPKAMVPRGSVPYWVSSMTHIADMYGHRFYREGPEPR
jgi:spore germination cell wall hydrolase CwlJ-like protein